MNLSKKRNWSKVYRIEVRMGRELEEPDLSRIQQRQGQLGGNHRISGLGPCYSPPWHIPSLDTLSAATTIIHLTTFSTCDGEFEPSPQDSKSWLEASDWPHWGLTERCAEGTSDPCGFPGGRLGPLSHLPWDSSRTEECWMLTSQTNFLHLTFLKFSSLWLSLSLPSQVTEWQ